MLRGALNSFYVIYRLIDHVVVADGIIAFTHCTDVVC